MSTHAISAAAPGVTAPRGTIERYEEAKASLQAAEKRNSGFLYSALPNARESTFGKVMHSLALAGTVSLAAGGALRGVGHLARSTSAGAGIASAGTAFAVLGGVAWGLNLVPMVPMAFGAWAGIGEPMASLSKTPDDIAAAERAKEAAYDALSFQDKRRLVQRGDD